LKSFPGLLLGKIGRPVHRIPRIHIKSVQELTFHLNFLKGWIFSHAYFTEQSEFMNFSEFQLMGDDIGLQIFFSCLLKMKTDLGGA